MSKHSAACCKLPPVVAEGYEPKGKYIELGGIRTYVTGPADASTAILSIYDIFGFFPQTIQGADIISASLTDSPASKPTLVLIPDFFDGNPADIAWYPPDTPEKGAKLGEWFGSAAPPAHIPKVAGLVSAAEAQFPSITSWGALGYCWGAKMTSILASTPSLPQFKAIVQTSPALIDISEATKITIPVMVLASKDENADEITAYENGLTQGVKHVETFEDQVHGWMSARGDLSGGKSLTEYERGYSLTSEFFYKNL